MMNKDIMKMYFTRIYDIERLVQHADMFFWKSMTEVVAWTSETEKDIEIFYCFTMMN